MSVAKNIGKCLLAVALGFALVAPVAAQETAAQGPPVAGGFKGSLGIGVISSPRPYVGADNQTRAIPLLDFERGRFYFRGVAAGMRMIDGDRFDLDVIGRVQFAGYEAGDSAFLAGMEERRETVELGLSAVWDLGPLNLEATAVRDALGRSDGVQAGLGLTWSKVFGRGRAGLFPGVGVIWQDSNFVDYYAGVRPEEARPGRPAFEGGSALNLGARLRGFVKVSDRLRVIGLLNAERFGARYEESPIIESRRGYFGLLALAYGF